MSDDDIKKALERIEGLEKQVKDRQEFIDKQGKEIGELRKQTESFSEIKKKNEELESKLNEVTQKLSAGIAEPSGDSRGATASKATDWNAERKKLFASFTQEQRKRLVDITNGFDEEKRAALEANPEYQVELMRTLKSGAAKQDYGMFSDLVDVKSTPDTAQEFVKKLLNAENSVVKKGIVTATKGGTYSPPQQTGEAPGTTQSVTPERGGGKLMGEMRKMQRA